MELSPRQIRLSAYKMVACQVIIAALVALIFYIINGEPAARSAFKGGLIAAIPNLVFALFAFWYLGWGTAEQAKTAFMRGHSLKILLTIGFFVLVMQQADIVAAAVLTGYILTLLAQWTAAIFFKL
ncbi:hypothetical protein VT06_06210 [Arsukibacterium sp. MJ3]|uniref:ATP synthase subunit I n=1 Tax=Arsukibacterium sp. MJ3 TaxID=1632859 RepID=UPI000626F0DC|nr:ATP synthase subunit I [Arsukibacterium sp. MJ3]KKO49423.1 hypothetical protein VT06_06210 [Arsukibacterium sp. MJ3]